MCWNLIILAQFSNHVSTKESKLATLKLSLVQTYHFLHSTSYEINYRFCNEYNKEILSYDHKRSVKKQWKWRKPIWNNKHLEVLK